MSLTEALYANMYMYAGLVLVAILVIGSIIAYTRREGMSVAGMRKKVSDEFDSLIQSIKDKQKKYFTTA